MESIRNALRSVGFEPRLTCVDFEAALNKALVHERYDVAIYDPRVMDLSRERVIACFSLYERDIPLVDLGAVDTLARRVLERMQPSRN